MKQSSNICVSCGDRFKRWWCEDCKAEMHQRCRECHGEKSHGLVPPVEEKKDTYTRRMEDRFPDELYDGKDPLVSD